jgi:hypothetical protein
MNSEIDEIVADNSIKPTFDEDAAVEILTWDDQWVTYDDADTFLLKTNFARSECLGGVMVWAISHDTADGKYTEALSKVTSRSFISRKSVTSGDDETEITISHQHPQCKWAGCKEGCPSGYAMVSRSDDGARKGEYMYDESGCDGDGHSTLCCPTSTHIPKCGWYSHNNGKCKSACASGMIEIGSNSKYCNNNDYQAACCELDADSMKLYTTVEWSESPMCDSGTCPWADGSKDKELVSSTTGSGGAVCNMRAFNPYSGIFEVQERLLCYDDGVENTSWDSCFWYDSEGPAAAGRGSGFCSSQCPSDKVRVALDVYGGDCYKNGGGRSYCCTPGYYDIETVEKPELTDFRDALTNFISEPTCPSHDDYSSSKRALHSASKALQLRQSTTDDVVLDRYTKVVTTFAGIIGVGAQVYTAMQKEQINIWNDVAAAKYQDLTIAKIDDFLVDYKPYRADGKAETARRIVCRLETFEDRLSEKPIASCNVDLCAEDIGLCTPDDDISAPASSSRGISTTKARRDNSSHVSDNPASILKRSAAKERPYQVWCAGTGTYRRQTIWSAAYFSAGEWASNNPIYDDAWDYEDVLDCGNPETEGYVIPTGRFYHSEYHWNLRKPSNTDIYFSGTYR